jgi:hypothetical protein
MGCFWGPIPSRSHAQSFNSVHETLIFVVWSTQSLSKWKYCTLQNQLQVRGAWQCGWALSKQTLPLRVRMALANQWYPFQSEDVRFPGGGIHTVQRRSIWGLDNLYIRYLRQQKQHCICYVYSRAAVALAFEHWLGFFGGGGKLVVREGYASCALLLKVGGSGGFMSSYSKLRKLGRFEAFRSITCVLHRMLRLWR